MTSLYQVILRNKVVETVTPKNKKVKRWSYIDIRKALDPSVDREEAIVGVPEDRIIRTVFGRDVVLDLSSPDKECTSLMFPMTQVVDWDKWQDGFDSCCGEIKTRAFVRNFGASRARFWKISNITVCRSLGSITRPRKMRLNVQTSD